MALSDQIMTLEGIFDPYPASPCSDCGPAAPGRPAHGFLGSIYGAARRGGGLAGEFDGAKVGQVLYTGPPTSDDLTRYRNVLKVNNYSGVCAGAMASSMQDGGAALRQCQALVKAGRSPFRADSGGDGVAITYRYNPTTNVMTIRAEASNNILATVVNWIKKACAIGKFADPRIGAVCGIMSPGGSPPPASVSQSSTGLAAKSSSATPWLIGGGVAALAVVAYLRFR